MAASRLVIKVVLCIFFALLVTVFGKWHCQSQYQSLTLSGKGHNQLTLLCLVTSSLARTNYSLFFFYILQNLRFSILTPTLTELIEQEGAEYKSDISLCFNRKKKSYCRSSTLFFFYTTPVCARRVLKPSKKKRVFFV